MTTERSIRASDQDREAVAAVLCDAYATGCLDRSELEERSGAAYAARTLGELRDLTADLPPWLFGRPVPVPHEYRALSPSGRRSLASPGGLVLAAFWLCAVAVAWVPLTAIPLTVVWLLLTMRPWRWRRRPSRPSRRDWPALR